MEGLHIPYRRLIEALETLNSPPVVSFNPLSVQSSVATFFQSRVSVNVCGKDLATCPGRLRKVISCKEFFIFLPQ